MAEAVGVVAATFEFAKIALQLKEVYSSLRHAPESLKLLLEELDALEEILQTIKDQEAALSAFAPPAVVQKCRLQTQKAVNGLKPVSEHLLKCMKRSRLRGSVRALLKEDALEKARQIVERAKTNFILAQMTSLHAMNMLNMGQHVETRNLILSSSASVTTIVQDLQQMTPSVALAIPANSDGNGLIHNNSHSVPSNSTDESRRWQWTNVRTRRLMLLQSRLLGKAIEFFQLNACGGWSYGFRTYNFRPDDAPVFVLVSEGNVAALQKLFQTGQASVLDRNLEGKTLLHVACESADAATVRFLLQQGIDPNDIDNKYNSSCIECIPLKSDRNDTLEVIQVLKEGTEPDALWVPDHIGRIIGVFTARNRRVNDVQALVNMISPPWNTWDIPSRLVTAYLVCDASIPSRLFWLCLSQSRIDSDCLVLSNASNRTHKYESLVRCLARVLGEPWWKQLEKCPDYEGWREIFRTAVRSGGLRTAFDHDCDSPMLTYLGFSGKNFAGSWAGLSAERLTHKVRHWAKEIISAGQQLEEYGRWEHERIFSKDETFSCFSIKSDFTKYATCRIIKFDYGTNPDEWNISVALSSDEYAGDFFESLSGKTEVPGAWPRDPLPHDENVNTHVFRDDFGDLHERWVCSKRRRRRFARYFGFSDYDVMSMYKADFMSTYVAYISKDWKKRRQRRLRFFEEIGLTPPPRLPY